MAYVPNATQTTEPVESQTVESAALEFRTLKTSVIAQRAAMQAELDGTQVDLTAEAAIRGIADTLLNNRTLALEQLAFNGSTPGTVVVNKFVATAGQTVFALTVTPLTIATVDVYVNGVYQNHDSFSVAANVVTLTEGVIVGYEVEIQASIALQLGVTSATQVQFTGPAGGARTVASKLQETPSFQDINSAPTATTMQTAIDSGVSSLLAPGVNYVLDKPLIVKNGTQRLTIRGENRIRAILKPSAISIAAAPNNINALILIQDNNAHLCIENLRFYSDVAYTGVGINCQESGGSDGLGQALFSGIFRNLWIDFATPNGGFLTGAVQNTVFDTVTCENMKGIFNFVGAGSADNHFRNFSLYNCYDHFIAQNTDTLGSGTMSVSGVHAYTHLRGRLFDLQNWKGGTITDVILEPAVGNLGNTGLFKFKDCAGLIVSNFQAIARSGVAACAVGIEIDTTSAKFSNGIINADVGLKISGTGAVDLEIENVDFTNCSTACFQIAGNATGTIRTRGCKFNNSQLNIVLHSVANGVIWVSDGDEFLNAGLAGGATSRNFALASSGAITIRNPRIGRDSGIAAASHFILATGSGTVTIIDPVWVGVPPSALKEGGQIVNFKISQSTVGTSVTTATYTIVDGDRDLFSAFAGTMTYTLPSAALYPGRRLTFQSAVAQASVSATANVVSRLGAFSTAILPATLGAWAEIVSIQNVWQVMASS